MFERGDAPALDPALLKEWEGLAGVDHHLGVAQRTSRAALDAVGPVDAETLQKGFDALPATASSLSTAAPSRRQTMPPCRPSPRPKRVPNSCGTGVVRRRAMLASSAVAWGSCLKA